MKFRISVITVVVITLVIFAGCAQLPEPPAETSDNQINAVKSTENGEPNITADSVVVMPNETAETDAGPSSFYPDTMTSGEEYSLNISGVTLTLRENNIEEKLSVLPLALISDRTKVLGPTSDTFTGSYDRTILYDGLELELFAPKDNPDNFWIMRMTVTNENAATFRGVRVGDSEDMLLDKYPEAEKSAQEENLQYSFSGEDHLDLLSFSFTGDLITSMTLTYTMP